jgi:ABC-type antimicrobial peptide transport system permease subunit
MQVLGVVRDAYYSSIRTMLPVVFVPLHYRDPTGRMTSLSEGTFIVRTASSNPLALSSMLREEVSRARPEFHVSNVRTQQELNEGQTIRERLLATLALFFAVVAWLLAGIGLYGVLIYSVIQRQREIGIRMALGAQAGDIVRPVVGATLYAVALGSILGLGAGLVSTRFIESLLYQAKSSDASMVAIPCLAMGLAVMMAVAPAVVRALRTNPVSLLRAE